MSKLGDARKSLYAAAIDYAANAERWQVLCQAASEYHLARMKAAGMGPGDLQNLAKGMESRQRLEDAAKAMKAMVEKVCEAESKDRTVDRKTGKEKARTAAALSVGVVAAQRKLEESIGARFARALEDPKGAQAMAAVMEAKKK